MRFFFHRLKGKLAPPAVVPDAPGVTWTSGASELNPTFELTGLAEGDTVQAQVDDNSDFSSLYGDGTNLIDAGEMAGGELTFSGIPTLTAGTTYYARFRIQRGGVWSDWSTPVSKTMVGAPGGGSSAKFDSTSVTFDSNNRTFDEELV